MEQRDTTIRLLKELSRQLEPVSNKSNFGENQSLFFENEELDNEVHGINDHSDHENDDVLPIADMGLNGGKSQAYLNNNPNSDATKQELLETKLELERVKYELSQQQSSLHGRITQLDEENRRLHVMIRRSKELAKEVERRYVKMLNDERIAMEDTVREVQFELEEERKRLLRQQYDIELTYRNEIASLQEWFEDEVQNTEARYLQMLKAAEDDCHDAFAKARELEEALRAARKEKRSIAKDCDVKLIEYELEMNKLKQNYEQRIQQEREARSKLSRKRVSEALDALKL